MTNFQYGYESSILTNTFYSINKKLFFIPLSLLFVGIFTLLSLRSDINLIKHISYVCLSIIVFLSIIFFNKNFLKTILNFSLFLFLFLLIYTHFYGAEGGGAVRWIRYGPFSVQPSELLKAPFICFISWFFYLSLKNVNYKILYFPLIVFLLVLTLLFLQPDIGTSIYFFISFFIVSALYIRKIKFFFILSLGGLIFGILAYFFNSHVRNRISDFLFNTSMQVDLSLSAINKGGLAGVGLGEGSLKYIIPESDNDFIFSIIIEEVGIIFGIFLIFMYPFYLYLTTKVSENLDNLFLKNTVFTMSFMTCFQAFVNISTSMNLIPPTGMPLPFISYGGSSLLSYAIIFGTVANFTRYEKSTSYKSS